MLYKKYHRNFIRKFKKGVKFRYEGYKGFSRIFEVVIEPYTTYGSLSIIGFRVDKGFGDIPARLIYSSGKLCIDIKTVEFIEDAV